ncbi:MAG: hypothetical protein JSR77_11685 [Planctomycetes bacterium]|nr:hypothetical protein [Planctomycetota bacterium]
MIPNSLQDAPTAYPQTEPFEFAARSAFRRWYIIRTRSRQEKKLSLDLKARGISCFLPLCLEVRYHGKRKVRVQAPLFDGYLFLHGTRDDAFTADRSERCAQLIEVADQQQLHEELVSIARVLSSGMGLARCKPLTKGQLVEVASGPLKGVRGRIEASVRDNRFVLCVDMIGKAAVLEIDRDLLDTIT